MAKKPVRIAIIGAGNRGRNTYGSWILRNRDSAVLCAVAEPDTERQAAIAADHRLPPEAVFSDWRDLIASRPDVDACIIANQDRGHLQPAIAAMEAGYHILLEKPMAVDAESCMALIETARRTGRHMRVAHVMRYVPIFSSMKRLIADGEIGDIVQIQHSENVAYWHFAHSYVRGPWKSSTDSSPVLLAKSCHDLDFLTWITDSRAVRVNSFAGRRAFAPGNAPEGAPDRCTDGCAHADTCLYYAPRVYGTGRDILNTGGFSRSPLVRSVSRALARRTIPARILARLVPSFRDMVPAYTRWPTSVLTQDLSPAGIHDALKNGPFGMCVYRAGGDQPDHQTVEIEFENGAHAAFTMHGVSYLDGRWFRIDGTAGSLTGRFTYAGEELILCRHGESPGKTIHRAGLSMDGHGGGDDGLMTAFVGSLCDGTGVDPGEALESHLIAFAAEKSRTEHRVVSTDEFRQMDDTGTGTPVNKE